MRLTNYINELAMSAKTQIKYKKKPGETWNAFITLDDGTEWIFNATSFDEPWSLVFYPPIDQVQIKGDKTKIGIKTFAAIEKVVEGFIKDENPEEFGFTGSGSSRVKLYNLLAKKIVKTGKYKQQKAMRLLQGKQWSFIRSDLVK